jgi:DNA-binding FadR family transcriptional regulator
MPASDQGRSESDTRSMARAAGYGGEGMKLAERTAAKIEISIVEQGWPLGSVIGSEADLLAEYGVSRAVLREAIRLLEHDHVAHMRRGPGGGLVVAEPDAAAVARTAALYLRYRHVDAAALFDARIALELSAVKSAAEHIDEKGIALLRETLSHEATLQEKGADSSALEDFHVVLAQLSGNPAIELFTNVVTKLCAAAFLGSAALFEPADVRSVPRAILDELHAVHEGIVQAIVAGDVSLAQHRMLRHLQAMARAAAEAAAADPAGAESGADGDGGQPAASQPTAGQLGGQAATGLRSNRQSAR